MKKIIALFLALTMLCSFAACGNKSANEPANESANETAKFKAGFIFLHDENSTYDLNFLNATKEACEALGVEYIVKVNIPESEA
ncbi:MAG: BMP family ABC transporter substrate-binding protein, partial [Firmicutes bacterium]|nr:BMP family ABC transporter substrate-binding protein [Bacillota bacterium]